MINKPAKIFFICVLTLLIAWLVMSITWHFIYFSSRSTDNPTLKVQDKIKQTAAAQKIYDAIKIGVTPVFELGPTLKCDATGEPPRWNEECHIQAEKYFVGQGDVEDALRPVKQATAAGFASLDSSIDIQYSFPTYIATSIANSADIYAYIVKGIVKAPPDGSFIYGVKISAPFYTCQTSAKYNCPIPPGDLIVHGGEH